MTRVNTHPILEVTKSEAIAFSFEGRPLTARKGEMISSALFAHGIRTFGLHPKDGTPQGIFCANGQCSQCMVIADGEPVKACMTPVEESMQIHKLMNIPQVSVIERDEIDFTDIKEKTCDLLIIGGGPSGLGAAVEAAHAGLSVVVVDDKDRLGGKLVLQTHMFFGSVEQCYAGTRGIDIAAVLAGEVKKQPDIEVMTSSMAVGVYSDGKVGVVEQARRYLQIAPRSLLVATGARERALVFPGCELPGVYGAGAFQTLLNRDLVRPSDNVFVVGGGNVGLIAAYHALQAGINVIGVAEGLPDVSGYWVHADKIRRFGVPIHTSTTVVCANGKDAVESVTVAEVDENWNIKPKTYRTYLCDTLLIAVGLERVNEFYELAERFGFDAYMAGDAEEIAEASAAMFSGRLKGRIIARDQGRDVEIPSAWNDMISTLKSKPGRENLPVARPPAGAKVFPVIWCNETIPCNPCTAVCPQSGIEITTDSGILARPDFTGTCRLCGKCVAACPGLAITLVDLRDTTDGNGQVTFLFELPLDFKEGDSLIAVDQKGVKLCEGRVVKIQAKQSRAPCSAACPAGVHAQGYIELIRKKQFRKALELLRADLPLPSVCGRVCHHPCEDSCSRADIDEPVSILALKRFVADCAMERDEKIQPLPITREDKVAVIGSGPSGLACANEMLRRGYEVTVFEAAPKAGGLLRYGIPAYRLPDRVLDWELACLEKLGIHIRTGKKIDSVAELRRSGFASIYISTGATVATRLGVSGEEMENVTGALDFLREANSGEGKRLNGTVAVIGGGNSALDAARVALRQGTDEVKVVYRRSREEMPAHDWEVEEAEREGIVLEFLSAPVRIEGEQGKAVRLVCTRMELGEPDESGRPRPMPVQGSEYAIPVDLVISAIGQNTDLGELAQGIEIDERRNISADAMTQATNMPDVFAGGDVVTGPATVVEAFGAGKRAAESMDRFLRGKDVQQDRGAELPVAQAAAIGDIPRQRRAEASVLASDARARSFDEILSTLTEEEALKEAERCLGCGVYSECLWALDACSRQSRDKGVLVTLEVDTNLATQVAGIRVQDEAVTQPVETVIPPESDDEVVVCRCERVTVGQIRRAIRMGVRDMNQLKAMFNTGMGACCGKTCEPLILSIFRQEDVPVEDVTRYTERPLVAEVPLGLFAGVVHKVREGGT